MAIKSYSGASGVEAGVPNTKLRAEQMKSEGGYTSLAVDLEAIRGQIKDILGTPAYNEDVSGYDVQLAELNPHLSGSYTVGGGGILKVKQQLEVVGNFEIGVAKVTVASATGNTAVKGTLDVDGQATLASANIEDLTSGRIVVAGALGELGDFAGLTFSSGELTAASATVSDLTAARVVYAGASGALVDSSEMTFGAGGLTLVKDLSARSGSFSGDMTIQGDLFVNGNTVTVAVGTLTIEDKNVVIAKDATGSMLDGAGIFLGSEAGESIQWNHSDTKWVASDRFMADEFQGDNLTVSRLAYSDANKVIQSVASLTSWVAGTANQVAVADDADGSITLSLPQSIHTDADVEFDSLKLGDLADNRLLKTDASTKLLVSAQIMDFITGSVNQVNLAAGAFGNVVLSTPQDIHAGASPEFAALNLASYGDLVASGSDFKVSATAALFLGDSYQAGSTFSTALKLAGSSAEWSAIEAAYGAEKTLLGMLAAAAPTTNQRLVKVGAPMGSAGPDFFITAADIGGAFPTGAIKYQGGLADVFVNGQKQVEGSTSDFEFHDIISGTDKVKVGFKYSLQIGDVVELVRYPAALK